LDRWKEEVELLEMELLRTAEYFHWMALTWGERGISATTPGERAHAFSMRLLFMGLEQKVWNKT